MNRLKSEEGKRETHSTRNSGNSITTVERITQIAHPRPEELAISLPVCGCWRPARTRHNLLVRIPNSTGLTHLDAPSASKLFAPFVLPCESNYRRGANTKFSDLRHGDPEGPRRWGGGMSEMQQFPTLPNQPFRLDVPLHEL